MEPVVAIWNTPPNKTIENHIIIDVGKELLSSIYPNLLLKPGEVEQAVLNYVQLGFKYLHRRTFHLSFSSAFLAAAFLECGANPVHTQAGSASASTLGNGRDVHGELCITLNSGEPFSRVFCSF